MFRFKTLCTAVAIASCVALVACEGAESRKEKYINVGLEMMQKGDLDKARISFKNVLKIDPKDINANYYFAQTLEKQEDWSAAAAQYKHVIDLDPAHTEATIAFGKILLLAKAADQVMEQADKVLQREAGNADAKTLKAGALLLKGNVQEAEALVDQVISAQRGHADASILKSSILAEKRDYPAAQSVLEQARDANPESVPVLTLLAKTYSAQNKVTEQQAVLEKIVTIAPRPENYARLSEFFFKQKRFSECETMLAKGIQAFPDSEPLKRTLVGVIESQNDQPRAEKLIRSFVESSDEPEVTQVYLAEKLFAWHREKEAVELLQGLADQKQSEKAALAAMNLLAVYQQSQGKLDESLTLVNQVIERNPADVQALTFRAQVAIEKGDYDSAITDLRSALNQEKRNPQLMKPLVVAYLKRGDIDLALDQVKTLLGIDPMSVETHVLAAQVFEQGKDLEAVDQHLNAALRLQPNSEPVIQALVGNAVQRKAWDRVVAYTTLWSKLNPENAKAYYLRGIAEEATNQTAQALAFFTRALALQPDSVEPATAIVRMYLSRNQVDEAKHWVDSALQNGSSAHLLNLKGEIQLAGNDVNGAKKSLEAAIAMQPDWWIPYRTLAMVAADAKDVKTAAKWFDTGIEKARNSALLRAEYAALLEKQGNTEGAIGQYRAIVNAGTGVPEAAINNLAMLLVTYDVNPQKIEEALALAARLEATQNPWYLDTVGWVNLQAGQHEKALQFIQRAADNVADQPVIQYHLGAAYYAQKDAARAVAALHASLTSGKKFPGMKDAESLLKKLQRENQQG